MSHGSGSTTRSKSHNPKPAALPTVMRTRSDKRKPARALLAL